MTGGAVTDPSNPTYQIAKSSRPPQFAPEHQYVAPQVGARLPCWHAEFVLDSGHIVRCGLPLQLHPPHVHDQAVNQLWDRSDGP